MNTGKQMRENIHSCPFGQNRKCQRLLEKKSDNTF